MRDGPCGLDDATRKDQQNGNKIEVQTKLFGKYAAAQQQQQQQQMSRQRIEQQNEAKRYETNYEE